MIHLSSYHSNGLPTVVWSNKVNLIGEKVYKPKIHFCEHCNKPILIYGRLIPCKHVFCFTCATLCSIQQQSNRPSLINIDESTSNTTPTTIQQDASLDSPTVNAGQFADGSPPQLNANSIGKGCHRCGGKALRVERNTLNSIFVCQLETCRRTYLSARDLQAHVKHRHSESESVHQPGTPSVSLAAISSSPYISSSSLMHLNNHNTPASSNNHNHNHHNHHRQSTSSMNHPNNHSNNSPSYSQHHSHHNRHDRDSHHGRNPIRDSDRFRDRDNIQRDRERERDSKEYHRQSLQRAAQWAEASAQIMEKGLTR